MEIDPANRLHWRMNARRLDSDALFDAVRERHPEAPAELYWRWYARMHSRLCVLLGDGMSADGALGDAFGRVLDALEDPTRVGEDPEELIYEAVDACAARTIEEDGVVAPSGPPGGIAVSDPALDEPFVLRDTESMWIPRGRAERDKLLRALGLQVMVIEHVGSTAVEGSLARPVLDLLAGLPRMPVPEAVMQTLEDEGYEDCGDGGVPGRRYLRKSGWQRIDLHLVEYDGPLWEDTLLLRDHLRRDPGEADRWGRAKRIAESQAAGSVIRYAELRRGALEELLERARENAQVAG
jgi:GrpB-like predicted nucleotidyltransferase (UPF0157 family)